MQEGYDGARMQQIADRAGINKALLHYYFRSKDKLFALIFEYKMQQFVPQIQVVLHDDSIPFVDKVERFVDYYLRMLRKNPFLPLFIVTTVNRNPDLTRVVKYPLGQDVIQLMRQEMAAGRIRDVDPPQFLLTLIGMCVFPFMARPMFMAVSALSDAEYDRLIAERHSHVCDVVRVLLSPTHTPLPTTTPTSA